MRRLLSVAARLYPWPWRARYGREFDLLLDEAGPSWRQLCDVIQGAIFMHINARSFASITVLCGLIGIAAAAVFAFTTQDRYVSTSVVRIPSLARAAIQIKVQDGKPYKLPPATQEMSKEIWGGVQQAKEQIHSRKSLTDILVNFGLYPEARRRKPLEDVLEDMKRDISIEPLYQGNLRPPSAVRIQFISTDRGTARAVTRYLTMRFLAPNPLLPELELLDDAKLPSVPIDPKRRNVIATGLGVGLLIGLLAASFRRWHMRHFTRVAQ